MTSSPKKHIIDSLLREIYGEKSPPDQTDEILRRLESGDSSLLTESGSEAYSSDSGPYPLIRPESTIPSGSPLTSWIAVAASIVFCVGLIGAMAKVLIQSGDKDQLAEKQTDENLDASQNSGELKRSDSLATRQPANSTDPDANPSQLAQNQTGSNKKATGKSQPSDVVNPKQPTKVEPFSSNPLPVFAENAKRLELLEVKARIDESLAENWRVHVITNPVSISKAEWTTRVYEKLLGRKPEADELTKLENYLGSPELPSTENRLRIVESIMTDESTKREFAHFWADRFLIHLAGNGLTKGNSQNPSPEFASLKNFVRQAFVKKEPLDELVKQILTANGSVDPQALEFNGAAGFVAMAGNDPNRLAENISRSFLGTELTCAKCHADIVHEQSRMDYLGLTSFLQGTNVTRKQTGVSVVTEVATNRKVPGLFFNSRNGLVVYAAPLIAGHNAGLDQENARQSLAVQLVRSDRFAKAMVNWIWSEIYGYGLAREGRINQSTNAPHQLLMDELSEQLVANKFDFRAVVKWAILSKPFSANGQPSTDTLAKDIPKYGGVAFFSYVYEQLEHDPVASVSRLAKAYQHPEGLSNSARLSLNIKAVGKGIEIIDQVENGVLPNGLKIDDEIPDFAKGWGVESTRVAALDRIADSESLTREQKIEHLYLLALHRQPTRAEKKQARSLFQIGSQEDKAVDPQPRSEREILQDLWWAILPR